jgi:hypothetical protein
MSFAELRGGADILAPMRRSPRRVVALLAAAIACTTARDAAAQSRGTVAVLGFGATPTEDEAARTITTVLEQSARRVGLTVASAMPSLEQALAVVGCEEVFVDDCMPRIVENLRLERVIYGRAVRRGENIRFEITFFDATTRVRRHTGIEVPRALAVDSDTLGRFARRALAELIPATNSPASAASPAPRSPGNASPPNARR